MKANLQWLFRLLAGPGAWLLAGSLAVAAEAASLEGLALLRYPLARLLDAADLVGRSEAVPVQVRLLRDADDGVRYWAAVGLHAAGEPAEPARAALREALKDTSAVVRIEAAAGLAEWGEIGEPLRILEKELRSGQFDVALHAARALELLGVRTKPIWPAMRGVLERLRSEEKPEGDSAMFLRFSLESALGSTESGRKP